MAARRLTKYDRNRIVSAVVNQVFEPKKEALDEREKALSDAIIVAFTSKKERELMAQLPLNFFRMKDSSYYVRAFQPETNKCVSVYFRETARVPSFLKRGSVTIEDRDLWLELEEYQQAVHVLDQEKRDFSNKTYGVVNSFGTFKAALESWPTLRELMGEEFFSEEPPANLPAPVVNELDEMLKAAMPEAETPEVRLAA